MSARFHVDPVDWYREAEPVEHLPGLARAVLDQRVVAMRYESWTNVRDWRVEPYGLVLKAGAWYLVANAGGRLSTFRVGAILSQQVLEERFERPAAFDLPVHWAESLTRFEAGLRPETALVRASAEGRRRLAELGAYAAQAVREADPQGPDGWAQLRLPIESVDRGALALLGVGPEAEVIAPPALRTRLRELAVEIARLAD